MTGSFNSFCAQVLLQWLCHCGWVRMGHVTLMKR